MQAVSEILYGHKYLLNPPPLATIPEESETGKPFNKKPRIVDDYARYKNVLPDVKSINEYKHKKTLYQEIHAANVLINKPVRLHCITIPRQDLVEMVNGPL